MIKLPLFSTVNGVTFPGHPEGFNISRSFSKASVKEALAKFDGELIVSTQTSIDIQKPNFNQIFHTGCVCKITNYLELPDGTVKFKILAKRRITLKSLNDDGDVRFGIGEVYPDPTRTTEISKERKERMIQRLKSLKLDFPEEKLADFAALNSDMYDFEFIMCLGHLITHEQIKMREVSLMEVNQGISILDVLTAEEKNTVNQGMARMHKILESVDFCKAADSLETMLC